MNESLLGNVRIPIAPPGLRIPIGGTSEVACAERLLAALREENAALRERLRASEENATHWRARALAAEDQP